MPTPEYSLALLKLILPPSNPPQRLSLIVANAKHTHTIGPRAVKAGKLNFYRESICISQIQSGIGFTVVENLAGGGVRRLGDLQIDGSDLKCVNKRAAVFRIISQDLELVFEMRVFTQDSEEENEQTEKDYTEFAQICEKSGGSAISQEFSQKGQPVLQMRSEIKNPSKTGKRSISTESSSWPRGNSRTNAKPLYESPRPPSERQMRGLLAPSCSMHVLSQGHLSMRKKTNPIKSHLYSNLIANIANFFSPRA